jgi:hypothetical protein
MADLERMNLKRQPWRIAERYYKESKATGMGSWSYAWILDPLMDERERGLTINISFQEFKTKKFFYNLIDAPGHSEVLHRLMQQYWLYLQEKESSKMVQKLLGLHQENMQM